MQTATDILTFLVQFKDEEVIYIPNPGNGGDALIAMATYQLFDRLNIKYVIYDGQMSLEDRVIIYAGGGNLVKYYSHAREFLLQHLSSFKRLVILPHTIADNDELLAKFGDNVDIICREVNTYQYVSEMAENANVYLSHDMAIEFCIDDFVNSYKNTQFWFSAFSKFKFSIKLFINVLKTHGNIISFYFDDELFAFRNDVESKVSYDRSIVNLDLSSIFHPKNTYKESCVEPLSGMLWILKKYKTITTDRLHVMILAALMGKKVNFYPGDYYKNKAVYEFTVKDKGYDVTFIDLVDEKVN